MLAVYKGQRNLTKREPPFSLRLLYVREFQEVLVEVVDLDDGDDDEERGRHELDEEAACVIHLGRIREVLQSPSVRGSRTGNKHDTHKLQLN